MKHSAAAFARKYAYLFVLFLCLFASTWAAGIIPAIVPGAVPTVNRTAAPSSSLGTARFAVTDSAENLAVAGALTSGAGSGITGALDLTGATSGNVVTLTVGANTAAGTLTLPGVTGTLPAISGTPTAGNCAQWVTANTIGQAAAGCASGGSTSGGGVGNTTAVTVSANTTADQTLQELALPAAYLNTANQQTLIVGSGIFTIAALQTPTLAYKVKLCTISGCGSGTVVTLATMTTTSTVAATNNAWNVILNNIGTKTTGVTGNLMVHGFLSINIGASSSVAESIFNDTNTAASSNIDLTAALFVDFTVATSAGNAGNSFTQQNAGAAVPGSVVSVAGLTGAIPGQGTDSKVMTAGTVAGLAATLCTDALGGATTTGCSSGGGATAPTTGWTIVNGALLSNNAGPGIPAVHILDNASLNWRLVTRPVTIPYTLQANMRCGMGTPSGGATLCGLYIYDGTKLEGLEVLMQSGAPNQLRVEKMATVNTDSGTLAGATQGLISNDFVTLQIANDGVNRTFSYYSNGAYTTFFTEAAGTFLTETKVGFGGLSTVNAGSFVTNILGWWSGVA